MPADLDKLRALAALLPDETSVAEGTVEGVFVLRILGAEVRTSGDVIARFLLERLRVDEAAARHAHDRAEAYGEVDECKRAFEALLRASFRLREGRAIAAGVAT